MYEVDARFDKVLDRLAVAASSHLPYCVLRNLTDYEICQSTLAALVEIHRSHESDSDLWSTLIRFRNWRYTIVGCTAVVATRDARFFDDLAWRFTQGSFVEPQLAAALVVVHGRASEDFFTRLLQSGAFQLDEHGNPVGGCTRVSLCAFYALRMLNPGRAREFEPSSHLGAPVLQQHGGVAAEHDLRRDLESITYNVQYWARHEPPSRN